MRAVAAARMMVNPYSLATRLPSSSRRIWDMTRLTRPPLCGSFGGPFSSRRLRRRPEAVIPWDSMCSRGGRHRGVARALDVLTAFDRDAPGSHLQRRHPDLTPLLVARRAIDADWGSRLAHPLDERPGGRGARTIPAPDVTVSALRSRSRSERRAPSGTTSRPRSRRACPPLADCALVLQARLLALRVRRHAYRGDVELRGDVLDDVAWNVTEISKERPDEADGRQLHREAQTIVIATSTTDATTTSRSSAPACPSSRSLTPRPPPALARIRRRSS